MKISKLIHKLNKKLQHLSFSFAIAAVAQFNMGTVGNDILSDMGHTRDMVYGNAGNDVIVYTPSWNKDKFDHFDGGEGIDVVWLRMTAAEFDNAEFRTDLIRFYLYLLQNTNVKRGNDQGPSFTFHSFNLKVNNVENIVVERLNTRIKANLLAEPEHLTPVNDSSRDSLI